MYRFPPPMTPYPNNQWNCRPHGQFRPVNPQWMPNPGFRPQYRPHPNYGNNGGFKSRENDSYWCETCDRGFPTENILNKHKQEHQKCNIDGCQFIAHPKVITKHIQMQHSSGLYQKISKLNNPEEIEKWREERKKKYPTKANIDKKVAAVKEKVERGEKMGLPKDRHDRRTNQSDYKSGFGQKRKNNFQNDNQDKTKFRRNNNYDRVPSNNQKKKPRRPEILPVVEDNRKLKPFAGIQNLIDDDPVVEEVITNDLIEDVDDLAPACDKKPEEKQMICGALSSLMCEYGSSDDEVGEAPIKKVDANEKEKNNLKVAADKVLVVNNITTNDKGVDVGKIAKVENVEGTVDNKSSTFPENKGDAITKDKKISDDEDSGPDEAKVEKTEQSNNQTEVKPTVHKKRIEIKKQIYKRPKPKIPSTLLRKLLSKEMQRERNTVLQCIRYIRKNNYFDEMKVDNK